jgi:hypothetical protein
LWPTTADEGKHSFSDTLRTLTPEDQERQQRQQQEEIRFQQILKERAMAAASASASSPVVPVVAALAEGYPASGLDELEAFMSQVAPISDTASLSAEATISSSSPVVFPTPSFSSTSSSDTASASPSSLDSAFSTSDDFVSSAVTAQQQSLQPNPTDILSFPEDFRERVLSCPSPLVSPDSRSPLPVQSMLAGVGRLESTNQQLVAEVKALKEELKDAKEGSAAPDLYPKEVEQLVKLGFTDRALNRTLLNFKKGELLPVITFLTA